MDAKQKSAVASRKRFFPCAIRTEYWWRPLWNYCGVALCRALLIGLNRSVAPRHEVCRPRIDRHWENSDTEVVPEDGDASDLDGLQDLLQQSPDAT